jgi:bacterioferritin
MKAQKEIIKQLNEQLCVELGASDAYLIQSRLFKRWGYQRLAARYEHESMDERTHADKLIERILYLGGIPDSGLRQPYAPHDGVLKNLQANLEAEHDVRQRLQKIIKLCFEEGDTGTREVLEQLLIETEQDHILWLETQLKAIAQIGLKHWLSEQMHGEGAHA